MGLFGANKPNVTRLNHKDEYYKDYYFNKKLCAGIELVAAIERTSKKNAALLLIERGFRSYMGEKVKIAIEDERAARELNQKVKMTRFVMLLRRYAREHGMDISKII
jgi:hypothetical protein